MCIRDRIYPQKVDAALKEFRVEVGDGFPCGLCGEGGEGVHMAVVNVRG